MSAGVNMANWCIIIILPNPPLCQSLRKDGNQPLLFQQHILSLFPFDLLHICLLLSSSIYAMYASFIQQDTDTKMRLKKSFIFIAIFMTFIKL